jgi:hypothetical protein
MNLKRILLILIAFIVCTVFSQNTFAAYRDTIQAESNLLYYWPMDQTSGTSLTAAVGSTAITVSGGAVLGATGKIDGTAVSFDGINDYAFTAASLNLTAYNKVVVEAVIYVPTYTTAARNIWEFGTSVIGSIESFFFSIDGGTDGVTALSNNALHGNAGYSLATYTRPTAGVWHHVAAVYDKSLSTNEASLYIDGVLQSGTYVLNTNSTNTFGNLVTYLMSRAGTGNFTEGKMQHLAIYSNLSAARITAHSDLLSLASAVTLTGPTSGLNGAASTNFTVGGNGTFSTSTIVTPSDGGQGGTFTPTTVTLSSGTPTATFTYTPASNGTKTISVTNDAGLTNPSSISYVVTSLATAVTLSGPTSGYAGLTSTNFTVAADGVISGTVTVTPSDSSGGGTFTPTSVAISSGTPTATFTYTAASTGTKTISVTNNGSLSNPSSISYVATNANYTQTISNESNVLYYWPMSESSGTSLAATIGSTAINVTGATVGSSGRVGNAVSFDGVNDYGVTASSLNLSSYSKLAVEMLIYIPSYGTTSGKKVWELGTSIAGSTGAFSLATDGGTDGATAATNVALLGNTGYSIGLYTRPTIGSWHHVVTVYDKTASTNEVSLYVDGVLQTVTSRPFNTNNTNSFANLQLYLMSRAGASLFNNAKMQHLAIYSDINSTKIGQHATLANALQNITLSGPSSGMTGSASTNFTVGGDGSIVTDVIVTPSDGADGGTFTPTTVTLTSGSPTAAFTYTPASTGTKTISITNNRGLTNPSSISYLSTPSIPATAVTISGPTNGANGTASTNFTVGADGVITGSLIVTPNDASAGGTFTPTTVTLTSGSSTGTFTYTPYQPGRKTISVTNSQSLTNPSALPYSVYGTSLAIGDSTVATYAGGNQIIDYLYTSDQTTQGWTATSIAVPGHTIAQQKTTYLATANRATFDVTIVQIGLNDLDPSEAASVAIARLQDLITTINANKKVGSKILIATMLPAKQRLIDVLGSTNGLIAQQKYLDINEAIKGNGGTPITGVDYRVSHHTTLLNDGSGNLAAIYDLGDHVHENNAARTIIGHVWRDGLARLSLLDVAAPSTPTIGTATGGAGSASIAFTISDFDGGADVTYTAISTPGSITGTGSSSPVTVTGLTAGTPYTFKVYGTNTAGSSSQSAASNSVTPTSPADVTAPIVSQITAVSSPTNDTTPNYVFTTNEAGTISYGGSCSSATTSATVGSNTITLNTLSEGTYSNCTITVTDSSSNASTPLSVNTFTIDTTAPTITNITSSKTNGTYTVGEVIAIQVTFSEAVTSTGSITVTLETGTTDRTCTFTASNASSDSCNYTVQAGDTSSDLEVNSVSGTVADQAGNAMSNFTPVTNLAANKALVIDTTAPTISEVTPVATPTNDTTPDYTFTTNEAGSITYGGSCSSATTSASSGSNTVTFNTLALGTYTNCTITVTDPTGNASSVLSVSSFTIEATPVVTPTPAPTNTGGSVAVSFLGGTSNASITPSVGSEPTPAPTPTPTLPSAPVLFTQNLKLGMTSNDVLRLQQFLNTHGFPVSLSGVGSKGNETRYFGPATFKALVKFQKAYGIQPTSGFFGPISREVVNRGR